MTGAHLQRTMVAPLVNRHGAPSAADGSKELLTRE
jgi:hypothetical protein